MRPRTSSRSPLTYKTATARFCPCLLASSSSRTSFSRCSIILHCLSIRQKKDRTAYPAKAGPEGAIKEPLGSQVHLRRSTGNVCAKRRRGLHRQRQRARAEVSRTRGNSALICYDSAISTRELHRVTQHCKFGVSPLEIGEFGAVPPSPPLMQAQVVHTTWAFCIGPDPLVERYRLRLRGHRSRHRQILPPRRSSTHALAKPWQPCLKMAG